MILFSLLSLLSTEVIAVTSANLSPSDCTLVLSSANTTSDAYTTDTASSIDPVTTHISTAAAPATSPSTDTAFLTVKWEDAGIWRRKGLTVRPVGDDSAITPWNVSINTLVIEDIPDHVSGILCMVKTDSCPGYATDMFFYRDLYFNSSCHSLGIKCWDHGEY